MSQQTTPAQRRGFYERHRQEETYPEIAQRAGVSKECVRYWCRRQRDGGSTQTMYPHEPRGWLSEFDARVRYGILRLRLEHPHWGPGRIRANLKKRPSLQGLRLPSDASIGRYLHQWPCFRRQTRPKLPLVRPHQPTVVHQCWQIDFKVGIALQDGSQVDLHTVRDPVGEACLEAKLYPTQIVNTRTVRVALEHVRTTLRVCFARWHTLPDEVQTDGESTLVTSRRDDFPTVFTLWLTGLGIAHRVIRPGTPTDNAEVERGHRTLNDYAIIGNEDKPLPQLQTILDQAVDELAFELPSRAHGCQGKPPVEAHPELVQPRRPFQPEHELALFDLHRVDAFLATFTWRRKVGKTGQICLGGHHHYYTVGRAYAQRDVLIRFDPLDRHFVFYDPAASGQELGRRPARGLAVEDLTDLVTSPDGLLPQQLPLPFPLLERGKLLMSK
jgi:transposase InsO family protein